jgi:hypothetical protein
MAPASPPLPRPYKRDCVQLKTPPELKEMKINVVFESCQDNDIVFEIV